MSTAVYRSQGQGQACYVITECLCRASHSDISYLETRAFQALGEDN